MHNRHCFGKTLVQTLRGVIHVAQEKSRKRARAGCPPGD